MSKLRRQLQDMQQARDNYRAMWEGLNEEIQKGKKSKPAELHDAGDRIIMDISIEEAMTLEFILSHVGGHEELSPRKFAASVYNALHEVGISHTMPDYEQHSTGSIFFKDGDIREYSKYSGSK